MKNGFPDEVKKSKITTQIDSGTTGEKNKCYKGIHIGVRKWDKNTRCRNATKNC